MNILPSLMETVNDNDGNGTISRNAQGAPAKRACCLSIELQNFGERGDEDSPAHNKLKGAT